MTDGQLERIRQRGKRSIQRNAESWTERGTDKDVAKGRASWGWGERESGKVMEHSKNDGQTMERKRKRKTEDNGKGAKEMSE